MHTAASPVSDQPLDTFHRCHEGIVSQLERTTRLSELADAAQLARQLAQDTLQLFEQAVIPHHAEEESELFPAVLASALPQERERVQALVRQLTQEHRDVEAQWKQLEPTVKKVARGQDAEIDDRSMAELIRLYLHHARSEEEVFLPLCEQILGRNGNHMAALGLSLHMRNLPPVPAYI